VVVVVAAVVVGTVGAHPTYYPDVSSEAGEYGLEGSLPPFRSYHVHVMFQPEHHSDSCTGYDEAMAFRDRFIRHFDVSEVECEGDFDQGRLCMFPTALRAFGPFPAPQWAAFIPYEDFPRVSVWMMQYRGPFSVFMHPNSGFEREDHGAWGAWAGQPWFLDLTAAEFAPALGPLYPAHCRNAPELFEIPTKTTKDPPTAGVAHVRGVNLSHRRNATKYAFSASPADVWGTPALGRYENTWYEDMMPTSQGFTAVAVLEGGATEVGTLECPNGADSWTTLAVTDDGSGGALSLVLQDDNSVYDGLGRLRFVNIQPTPVSVRRDGEVIVDLVEQGEASAYTNSTEGQYMFDFVNTDGVRQVTLPFYVNSNSVLTVVITPTPSRENRHMSVLLIQDFPRDAP